MKAHRFVIEYVWYAVFTVGDKQYTRRLYLDNKKGFWVRFKNDKLRITEFV